jgi:hypothetical protein
MTELQYTLLSDGSTDRVLMPILKWLLHQHLPNCVVQGRWADLGRLRRPPKRSFEKIRVAVDLYPCNMIFVHRDAETASLQSRQGEVHEAVCLARETVAIPCAIAVVPVRMIEAWLLFDEQAIRAAAGNPNGAMDLNLPRLVDVEDIPNPKDMLHDLILEATELGAHRRKRFPVSTAVQRIPQYTDDFSPLRALSAFSALEERLEEVIREQQWHV